MDLPQQPTSENHEETSSEANSSVNPRHVKEPTLKEEFTKITNALATSPFYPELSHVLHWRDPIRTGLVVGIFHFTLFLISYGEYSVLTLASYCALTLLVVAFAYTNGSVLFAKYIQGLPAENPLSAQWSNAEPLPHYIVEKHLDSVANIINALLEVSRDVFYCVFPILSIKFGAIFFGLSLLGKWFSGLAVIYIVVLISLVWPRLYEEKHNEIDQYWDIVVEHVDTYGQLALSKIPKLDKIKKTQ